MKAILMSIKPEFCQLIFEGKKTIEVRKSAPKLEPPFKVFVYMTKSKDKLTQFYNGNGEPTNGKVIGSFVCDKIYSEMDRYFGEKYDTPTYSNVFFEQSCLSLEELNSYLEDKLGYGWHITEPKQFKELKQLSEFSRYGYSPMNGGGYCDNPDCKYFEWTRDMQMQYEPPVCNFGRCCALERPPQSWCYVEVE